MKSRIWCLLAIVALTGCAVGSTSDVTSDSDETDEIVEAATPPNVKPAATQAVRGQEAATAAAKLGDDLCAACGPSPQPWQERPAMDPAR